MLPIDGDVLSYRGVKWKALLSACYTKPLHIKLRQGKGWTVIAGFHVNVWKPFSSD